ncbi:MAG: hypothetical protein HY303_01855 [Candidatus Wallbacteria bacterium]|nr:hypothetical protein [Candidatus Wallbacteria bacterium]
MVARQDWERVFEQVSQALEERRKTLKAELDGVWDGDPGRSSDVLNRMLAVSGRVQLLGEVRDRFVAVARASRALETQVRDIQDRLDAVLEELEGYRKARAAMSDEELHRIASLFAEELGKESVNIDFASFAPDEVEVLARVLDRSRSRMEAGAETVPVDLGEKGIEARPAPREQPAFAPPIPAPEPVRPAREVSIATEISAAGLEEELEEETGILLADEVVDLESSPAVPVASTPPVQPHAETKQSQAAPAEDDEDVVFVDDGS